MPAKSTTIPRIEALGLETQRVRAFDHGQRIRISPELEKAIVAALESWQNDGNARRHWADDARLWTGSDEAKWRLLRAHLGADVAAGLTTLKEAIRQALV